MEIIDLEGQYCNRNCIGCSARLIYAYSERWAFLFSSPRTNGRTDDCYRRCRVRMLQLLLLACYVPCDSSAWCREYVTMCLVRCSCVRARLGVIYYTVVDVIVV